MKFGKVAQPELIDFTIPQDDPYTEVILSKVNKDKPLQVFIGCAKWNRQDLKNFYPRGTKDELEYYASQFNSIGLNATFYRIFASDPYDKWYEKTPENFKFFPKVVNSVSHLRKLNDQIYPIVDEYLNATSHLKDKLGTIFL